jgi:hypothetical protein
MIHQNKQGIDNGVKADKSSWFRQGQTQKYFPVKNLIILHKNLHFRIMTRILLDKKMGQYFRCIEKSNRKQNLPCLFE